MGLIERFRRRRRRRKRERYKASSATSCIESGDCADVLTQLHGMTPATPIGGFVVERRSEAKKCHTGFGADVMTSQPADAACECPGGSYPVPASIAQSEQDRFSTTTTFLCYPEK